MSVGSQVAPRRRPTLKAVAEGAGVSVSTASLVFSGSGPVAAATRDRVLSAAADLGYSGPDPVAASLRRGRSDVVGVVIEGSLQFAFRDPFALCVADGLASVLDGLPAGMLMLAQDPTDPAALLERVRATALDAVVFIGAGPQDNVLEPLLRSRGIPIVGLGSPTGAGVTTVDIDNRAPMHGLVRHLLELGHQPERIAVLALPVRPADGGHAGAPPAPIRDVRRRATYPDICERLRGVIDLLGPAVPTVVASGSDVGPGAEATGRLLDGPSRTRPTAVIALSDVLAVGAIRAATDRGLNVPDDLSVTGFDGVPTPWWPGSLTTVVQPSEGKGARAGEAVRRALAGERVPDEVLPTEFRPGTSTGPPPP